MPSPPADPMRRTRSARPPPPSSGSSGHDPPGGTALIGVLDTIGRSLADGAGMFTETLWALVLGFGLSGAVQAFVSRAGMRRALGDHRPATITKAGLFGAISSSCSYA